MTICWSEGYFPGLWINRYTIWCVIWIKLEWLVCCKWNILSLNWLAIFISEGWSCRSCFTWCCRRFWVCRFECFCICCWFFTNREDCFYSFCCTVCISHLNWYFNCAACLTICWSEGYFPGLWINRYTIWCVIWIKLEWLVCCKWNILSLNWLAIFISEGWSCRSCFTWCCRRFWVCRFECFCICCWFFTNREDCFYSFCCTVCVSHLNWYFNCAACLTISWGEAYFSGLWINRYTIWCVIWIKLEWLVCCKWNILSLNWLAIFISEGWSCRSCFTWCCRRFWVCRFECFCIGFSLIRYCEFSFNCICCAIFISYDNWYCDFFTNLIWSWGKCDFTSRWINFNTLRNVCCIRI